MRVGEGITLRLAAPRLFARVSLCVRLASFESPVGQNVFWRSAVALVPIVLYLAILRQCPLRCAPIGHLVM